MSTPRSVQLPDRVQRVTLPTSRGGRAALAGPPPRDVRGAALLVPGFTGSKEDFLALLAPLAEHGWQAYAIDQLGQYESPGPDEPGAYALDALAADVRELVAHLTRTGQPVHLLGHSFGGLVCARSAIGGARPASLTLLCSGPGALPAERFGALPALHAALPGVTLDEVWQAKQAMEAASGPAASAPDDVHAFMKQRFVANSPIALREFAGHLMTAPDHVDALAVTGVPTLVAYGDGDDAWPLPVQDAMAHRLRSVPVVIDDAGHSPAVDQPEVLAGLLAAVWASQDPQAAVHGSHVRAVDPGEVRWTFADLHEADLPAAAARDHVRAELARAQADPRAVADAALVATELVSNALRHAPGPIALAIEVDSDVVHIAVRDEEPRRIPVLTAAAEELRERGRGLHIVQSASRAWGWSRELTGKIVWAAVPMTTSG